MQEQCGCGIRGHWAVWQAFSPARPMPLAWIIAGGSVGLAIGTITSYFFQIGSPETSVIVWAVIWLTVFMILNLIGVIPAANTQLGLVLGLVGLMLIFGIAALPAKINLDNYTPFMPNGFGSLFPAIASELMLHGGVDPYNSWQ